ncbi:MAG TPA: class I SAM-dependent methyltransferase [Solirubrobacteraceae bacterium]|nr:class I SAM-dependent methyltransferase [Solirubrobacteraceae bacterium]
MAERLRDVAAALVDLTAITGADSVLDFACGTGNAALIAADHAETVVGVDYEQRLLDIAAARSRASGRARISWICADALSPRVPEHRFSVVLSAFGLMYVPDHRAAAAALARASAPGARVGLAAWTPGSFMPAMGRALSPYLPLPPGTGAPPSRWGEEEALTELLRPHAIQVGVARRSSVHLSFADVEDARRFLIRTAGHVLVERPRLEREGRWVELERDLDRLVRDRNNATGGAVQIECEYLLALAAAAATDGGTEDLAAC